MPDQDEHTKLNAEKWDKWAKSFDSKWAAPFRYLQKKVISIANPQIYSNFLDLGCGTGWAVRYTASLLQRQGSFVGIDMSEGMIAKAKENSEGIKNVSYYKASAEELPLESNYFSTIICTFSIHHYLNPDKAISEACRVLKPKGRIYILDATPDDPVTRWFDNVALKTEKTHVKQYSTNEFKVMFLKAGLKYIKSKIVFMYPIKVHIGEK